MNNWMRNDTTNARENIANKVVYGQAGASALWHKFCEHRSCHGEDYHGPAAEEEVSCQLKRSLLAWIMCALYTDVPVRSSGPFLVLPIRTKTERTET
jgi:hypothetical protein